MIWSRFSSVVCFKTSLLHAYYLLSTVKELTKLKIRKKISPAIIEQQIKHRIKLKIVDNAKSTKIYRNILYFTKLMKYSFQCVCVCLMSIFYLFECDIS